MSKQLIWITISFVALCYQPRDNALMADDGEAFFESRIRPVLVERCQECHGDKKQEGGLRLDSRSAWQAGGEHGSVIEAGSPTTSRLLEAVRYSNTDLQMPPTKRLSDQEIEDFETWVKIGAPDPRDGVAPSSKADPRTLWSLQPVARTQPPHLNGDTWCHQPIDGFVLEKQHLARMRPSPTTDRRTLIRRATMDLIGLSPTAAEVESFIRDASPDAYEELLDRLLATPQYGENWARHWLDLARYSDTKGYVYAREENRWVHASAYRDWVVRSFNDDLAFDRFVRLQIAADQLLPADSPELAAMGFLTLGRRFLGVTHDVIDDRIDVVSRGILGLSVACARCHDHKYDPIPTRDYYSLYGVFQSSAEQLICCGPSPDTAFAEELTKREAKRGETMAKRREEQSQRVRSRIELYLLAQLELEKYPEEVFNQVVEPDDLNPFVVRKWQAYLAKDKQSTSPVFAKWHIASDKAQREQMVSLASEYGTVCLDIAKRWNEHIAIHPDATSFPTPVDERLRRVLYGTESPCHVPDEHITNIEVYFPTDVIVELWKLQGEVDRWLLDNDRSPTYATILVDRPIPSSPRVFLRGNPLTKGSEVSRHNLSALGGDENRPFENGSGRLELANALASSTNPLTARVLVNRVWMHHFGRGLVDTPSDFGHRAENPSHPDLLDWLSTRFVDSGWSIKSLHRMIMLSSTYQQGSDSESQAIDPTNRLLARMTARRLSFEQARDSWLQSSGELDLRVGGNTKALFDQNNRRRTLYANIDREKVSPILRMFDFANPDLSIPQRTETSVPQQALFAMNHRFIAERATKLAASSNATDPLQKIEQLYKALYQRKPTDDELQLAMEFLQSEVAAPLPSRFPSQWSYGYGEYDHTTGRLAGFKSLPHFDSIAWQGGDMYPDPKLGWLKLDATGGHPGNDLKHAIVRRWTSVNEGDYALVSKISHEPTAGDGIRAFVCHSESGLLRSATLHHSSEQINVESIHCKKGDILDFIVDIRDGLNSDQFLWSARITPLNAIGTKSGGAGGAFVQHDFDAEIDFPIGRDTQLNRWQQLAQVLMLANEFMFVD